jgi:chromosome segregation ATPase
MIDEMRKRFDESETNMNRRALELESKLADKEMEIKYAEQKYSQLKNNSVETEKSCKNEKEREMGLLRERVKEVERQRDELKSKCKESEDKLFEQEKAAREA